MRKMLRACALVIAIACTVQAGEMQNGIASQTPDAGTGIWVVIESLLSLF
jgi:hypothetical protein